MVVNGSSKYPPLILGLAFITFLCVYLGSENLYFASLTQKRKVKIIISPSRKGKEDYYEDSSLKLRRNVKDGLVKIHREAAQLQQALRHLLVSISRHNEVSINKNLKYQLRLTNDMFITIQEILQNDTEDLKKLQTLVTDRIFRLQHPTDCSKARKLLCYVNVSCGLGCVLNHLSECFWIALRTNRTLLSDYSPIKDKEKQNIFKPLSSCTDEDIAIEKITKWQGEESSNPTHHHLQIVKTIFHDPNAKPETKFVPLVMPTVIADKLARVHNDPHAWWMGQIYRYLTRLQPWVSEAIEKVKKDIGFSHPIVGVHVRRTGHTSDVLYNKLSQYMRHVNDWYQQYELRRNAYQTIIRKIYIATDDYGVVEEAKAIYTDYKILHDPLIKQHATMSNENTEEGLLAIISEVTVLSQCDFFIGTFSSSIGRSVYHIMQSKTERTFDVISLDTMSRNHGGCLHWDEAVMDYYPQDGDLELKIGDKIRVTSALPTFHRGFGVNERTKENGSYPMMKVKRFLKSERFAGF